MQGGLAQLTNLPLVFIATLKEKIMECSQCGTSLLADSSFCHKCGAPVQAGTDVGDSAPGQRVFMADDATTLVWQSGESSVKIKLAASDLSTADDGEQEHTVYSIEDLVRLLRENANVAEAEDAEFDPTNEVIFHIFTAWR
jgi:hypothetical protein